MTEIPLTGYSIHKEEMEYHGKSGHTIGRIQHIALMSRLDICYVACLISTQTVATTITVFQGMMHCIQYLASHPHKPIFYTYTSYDGPNIIILAWIGNQVED